MKRKATSRRDNGGTPTLAQRGRGGNGKGGRTPMARGRGRGRGRGQGGAAMDGPGETRGKIGGSEGVQRRNRRHGETAVAEIRRLQRSTDLCIAYRPFVRLVKEIVQKEEVATNLMRFQMLAIGALLKTDSEKDKKMTAMTVEQVEKAEREVMKYVTEGIHYDNEDELRLLRERAPAYFNVTLDIQRSIAANGERSTRAQQLLHRLQQSAYVAKDETLPCCSAYTLQRVVEWMCDDEDIDKSKREGGGFYDRSAFKKFVTSRAKEARMLKTEAHDILKSNAAEILTLNRMNELPQTDSVDYQDLATVVVDDVEYVLLDQIMDFMLKTNNDTNLIHEALHEVTEDAIAAAELADVESTKDENQLVSRTPICQGDIFTVLEDLTRASTEADRMSKRMQGW
ncbi:hypothetical protein CBR_g27797 [Chara braunii]|uniref:Uncharacterized protein n=1 Tax=Chara braunii TaxID=69332 RepID=A0A388L8Q8_CHABU|nr:hypothetical protein CBR_g27797 [Chara braunii]|eukprot:GBG78573.1 hypothetical protein CBR_g27797 [Chara braunii]